MITTKHWSERNNRLEFIKNTIGIGNPVRTFTWDKGHVNGPELHTITDTGIIIIRNKRTKKYITTLIARFQQIQRYYDLVEEKAPQDMLNIALEHQKLGYNYK